MKTPKHLAIIMDGNGRWASMRGHQRLFGHVRGAKIAKKVISESVSMGIDYLTLYTFSTENWSRPATEVNALMAILKKYLKEEQQTLMKQNMKFNVIGNLEKIPDAVRSIVLETIKMTNQNTGMTLTFAINYGGRQEIVNAAKALAQKVKSGLIESNEIDEKIFSSQLETANLPDPDMVIRTSGESRISNFLLWQIAYSEIFITQTSWPDFTISELHHLIEQFGMRDRRFGHTKSVLSDRTPMQGFH